MQIISSSLFQLKIRVRNISRLGDSPGFIDRTVASEKTANQIIKLKRCTNSSASFFKIVSVALILSCVSLSPTAAQEVDVYFVVGQSNAANFANTASTGSTNVGFNLHFARTTNLFNDFPNHTAVAEQFSTSNLDASVGPTMLATALRQPGRDVAIFSFARNGAGLNAEVSPEHDDWIWYPGADPANGQLFNGSLYANAIVWNEARLQELRDAGLMPIVKGIFWFQGEKDGRLLDYPVYRQNFENLVFRFRQDYGADLPIVATQIREIQNSYTLVNDAAKDAAAADAFIGFVGIENLQYIANANNNNVHLTSSSYAALAPIWSNAMLELQFALGDVNQDGAVGFLDISPFISLLSNGGYSREADLDVNGEVNFFDIAPFIDALSGNLN